MEKNLYELELLISKILRYGVILAGILIFLGWAGQFQLRGDPFAAFHVYRQVPLRGELAAAVNERHWGVLVSYLGLTILVLLPFTRVLMTMILFFKQKEMILAGVSLFVCLALIASFLIGARG